MVALSILFTVILFLTIDYFVVQAGEPKGTSGDQAKPVDISFARALRAVAAPVGDQIPTGVFVTPEHLWVRVNPSGSIQVGVDRVLLTLLGGLEHIYALPPGTTVRRGGPLVMLRRCGRALKVCSPVDGVVSVVNERGQEDPEQSRIEPFENGWVYEISPRRLPRALQRMLSGEAAVGWMRDELHRLRDLLHARSSTPVSGCATAVDGGQAVESLADHVDDAEWEALVKVFFGAFNPKDRPLESGRRGRSGFPAGRVRRDRPSESPVSATVSSGSRRAGGLRRPASGP